MVLSQRKKKRKNKGVKGESPLLDVTRSGGYQDSYKVTIWIADASESGGLGGGEPPCWYTEMY